MKAKAITSSRKLQVQSSKEHKSQAVNEVSEETFKDSFNYLTEDEDLKEAVRQTNKELGSIS